jgi:YHS domain-containing protein
MECDEKQARARSQHKGKTYYFCAVGCKKAFDANQDKYVGKEEGKPGHGGHKM